MDWEYKPRIAALREAKLLTQLELAQLVGVTETTIANWEKGRSGTEWLDRLIRLCAALECDPDDLLSYIPQTRGEEEGTFSEMVRLIEEGHQRKWHSPVEGSEDLDLEAIEKIAEEGGKFSDIVKLVEAGQRVQANRSALPSPVKGSAKRKAVRRSSSEP